MAKEVEALIHGVPTPAIDMQMSTEQLAEAFLNASNAVPQTRMINSKKLTGNVDLTAEDVGAVPAARKINGKELNKDIYLLSDDVGSLPNIGYVPYGKELTETWADLRTRIAAGDFTNIHIGDYKKVTLSNGEVVTMEVAGIDTYYMALDTVPHHMDFISRDCLDGIKKFNETDTNNGTADEHNPWRASLLFKTLNDETTGIYSMLPDDLIPYIIPKVAISEMRYSGAGAVNNSTAHASFSMGNLWIPTEVEVFGNTFWSDGDAGWTGGGGCNVQYPIFCGGMKHIIKGRTSLPKEKGSSVSWWLSTARRQSPTQVCQVSYLGNAAYFPASGNCRVPLCFRIG